MLAPAPRPPLLFMWLLIILRSSPSISAQWLNLKQKKAEASRPLKAMVQKTQSITFIVFSRPKWVTWLAQIQGERSLHFLMEGVAGTVGIMGSHIWKHSTIIHPLAPTVHTYTPTHRHAKDTSSPQIIILYSTGSKVYDLVIIHQTQMGMRHFRCCSSSSGDPWTKKTSYDTRHTVLNQGQDKCNRHVCSKGGKRKAHSSHQPVAVLKVSQVLSSWLWGSSSPPGPGFSPWSRFLIHWLGSLL